MNNLDENHVLYKTLTEYLAEVEDGCFEFREAEAVDTRESIENFFEGKEVKIYEDTTDENGIRKVHCRTSNPIYKNSIKEFVFISDDQWTLVFEA